MTDAREASIERGQSSAEPSAPLVPDFPDGPRRVSRQCAPRAGGAAVDVDPSSRARGGTEAARRIVEWVVVVVFAVLVAGGLRTFVVQAFFVPSGSMLPTLQIGDRIVVIKFGYTIHRGDIVVFKRPPQRRRHARTRTSSSG